MSSITVVEELMRRAQKNLDLLELPRPSKHFKLIIGAGFSGLLAIMFGRLDMSVEEARAHCLAIVNEMFLEKKRFSMSERFKASKLEVAVKKMLVTCGAGADARMMDPRANGSEGCKVVVCVAPEHGMRAGVPVRLRIYPADRNSVPDCTIGEALRATFALPGLFKPVAFTEPGGIKVSYIGLNDKNPTVQLLEEAADIFPDGHMACVVSIGAGQAGVIGMECERTAQEMSVRFKNTPGIYFRLGVDQGMRDIGLVDWNKMPDAVSHARSYLLQVETDEKIAELVKAIEAKAKGVPTTHLKGVIPTSLAIDHTAKECPPPSRLFVGREIQLSRMRRCLVNSSEERHVYVVHGLGGVGKTQLALKFVQMHKNEYQQIFYIDATSAKTVNANLKNVALANKVGKTSSDALAWLARLRENWLVVYNNADNTSMNLRGYFPACSHGNILVTTRNRRMVNLAQGVEAECYVSEMLEEDSQKLLAKSSGATGEVGHAGLTLIKELEHFPLAIVQAGAYIHTRCCSIEEYLEMYRDSQGELLEEYADLVEKADDYDLTAYASWRISYLQLHPIAKQLYDLLAFMHYDQISENIFRFAVLGLIDYKSDLPFINDETSIKQPTSEILANFTRATDGTWDKAAFMRTVDNLQSYSLVDFDPVNRCYSIHPLVHQWTRTMVNNPNATRGCTAFLLATSVIWRYNAEDYGLRRALLNHLDSLPKDQKLSPRLAERFELVYREAGRDRDAEQLQKAVIEAKAQLLRAKHPGTLTSMSNLASTYRRQGRWKGAEELEREVLEVRKQVLGSEHPDTLASTSNLANTYWRQGRLKKAEKLEQEVLQVKERVFGGEHPSTLTSMGNLASSYWEQGRWKGAEKLEQKVLKVRKRMLGSEHPDTLTIMSYLARAYDSQGRWKEAEVLEREVLETRKRVLWREHPNTLTRMNNLGSTYRRQGQWGEAEVLGREVVEARVRVHGSEHPSTLTSMSNLASTYWRQGQREEANELQRTVLEVRKRVLGGAHPDTLTSMNDLAVVYRSRGLWEEAEGLMITAVSASIRVLGASHPETLERVEQLAEI